MTTHIIFDLDGTLVDSSPLCAAIINDMLRERGSARAVSAAEARAFMTRGGADTVTALLAADCGDVASELADFRLRYAALPTPENCLYPGVRQGLNRLAGLGYRMAVCSNKPQHLCEKTVQDLGLHAALTAVVGSRPTRALKPATDLVDLALTGLGATAEQCLFVGDSEVDFLTAEAAGIPFLFVSYGYAENGWTTDTLATVDCFDELVATISQQPDISPPLPRVA